MKVIGLMSGTSVDGVDAALCEARPDGDFRILSIHFTEYPKQLAAAIHALCEQESPAPGDITNVDRQLVDIFTASVRAMLKDAAIDSRSIAVIGSHGQTIRHCPDCAEPFSLQIGDPQRLAAATGIATVGDFRTADIQAGGQGAPLAPAFHNAVFRSPEIDRAILNIGGIANLTYLPASASAKVIGFDTGPGNTLMDYWIRKTLGRDYDESGAWAAGGTANRTLLARFLDEPYFAMPPPKSTGRELFSYAWLESKLVQGGNVAARDVAATLLALTVESVTSAIRNFLPGISEVYVCGGGVHNGAVMEELRRELPTCRFEATDKLGVKSDWVEAAAFAWLAVQTLEGKPGNLPSVTGARAPVVLGKLFRP